MLTISFLVYPFFGSLPYLSSHHIYHHLFTANPSIIYIINCNLSFHPHSSCHCLIFCDAIAYLMATNDLACLRPHHLSLGLLLPLFPRMRGASVTAIERMAGVLCCCCCSGQTTIVWIYPDDMSISMPILSLCCISSFCWTVAVGLPCPCLKGGRTRGFGQTICWCVYL